LDETVTGGGGLVEERVWYYNFFRAAARPLDVTIDSNRAVEGILRDLSISMWGIASPSNLDFRFFMVMDDRAILPTVPMYAQLLAACNEESSGPGGFAVVNSTNSKICARPDEVLFVLLTPSKRVFSAAPAVVISVLKACGFPDARLSCAMSFVEIEKAAGPQQAPSA
jgi:hypothetical protein